MEVDEGSSMSGQTSPNSESGKFANLKLFVNAAREFEATHSEVSVNTMSRCLGLIASSCDLSIFSPGRSEVCAFFSALWRVQSDRRAPHWAGVAVLARATLEPSARHALTHTYKFLPILSRLLSDEITIDKKIRLLTVMQDISYGIKIGWQESFLPALFRQLTDWITRTPEEPQDRVVGQKALTILVNVCYGNLPAMYTLMRTVHTKDFVMHLISMKECGYGSVQVCRLLLCLSGATRGARSTDVHDYLACAMSTVRKALPSRDSTQLQHTHIFIQDLCSEGSLRNHALTYLYFSEPIADAIKGASELCHNTDSNNEELDTATDCLRYVLKILTIIVNLELFSLRVHHASMVRLCIMSTRLCLPAALELFAGVVSQYREESRLPQQLICEISDGLALLVAPSLEPANQGLQWLQVVGALCETPEMQERLLQNISAENFDDTLYTLLQNISQKGAVGMEQAQQAVIVACRVGLALSPLQRDWDGALNRLLAHHQVRKIMSSCLSSTNGVRRREVLQIVKHPHFPSDKINQVFDGRDLPSSSEVSLEVKTDGGGECASDPSAAWCLAPVQEDALDRLIHKLNTALQNNQISDIAASSVMELYGYKMTCLEQRLHSHSVALQGATEHMASLQHTLAMLQATNTTQQDVLYSTQMHNEKQKETINRLNEQLEDAERTVRGFGAKLAAERKDKEAKLLALASDHRQQLANAEEMLRAKDKEIAERQKALESAQADIKAVQKKLEIQAGKNNELASVLVKFEERVKQRDKKLEEINIHEASLRKDLDLKELTVKQLEKTLLERENRLYQVTTQLEEMKRVQEMVAKLMGAKSDAPKKS